MPASSPVSYLRYPDLHKDLVTFCAGDDVWIASSSGGRAWRLSTDHAPVSHPRLSPDGARVAWISRLSGAPEVMVSGLDSDDQRRLTYWGGGTAYVLGWTADGRVMVASTWGEANRSHWVVKAVGLDGSVERLRYGPASGLARHAGGAVALSTPFSRPPAWWKRYRGGTAQRLWLSRAGDDHWERLLPDEEASLDSPGWVGDQLVFASDLAATFPDRATEPANLYALDALGSGELRSITQHTEAEGYVRDPRTDGERIVYHAHGTIYLMPSLDAAPEPLDIRLAGSVPGRRPRMLDPTENLDQVRPDHGGNASLVGWRGKVFYLAHREGPARALAADSGVRRREPRLLGRTGTGVWVANSDGVDRLEVGELRADAPADLRVLADGRLGRVLHLEPNPVGDAAAVITHDGRVVLLDTGSGDLRDLARSEQGEAGWPAFSPDGRYLVWSQPLDSGGRHQLVAVDLTAGADAVPSILTSGRFDDTDAAFSRDGKYLMFLSKRTFDPSYDEHAFNLTFGSATRPYLVTLDPAEPAPFGPSADGWRISRDEPASAGTAAEAADPPREPAEDPAATAAGPDLVADAFEDRIVPFPVLSGAYRSLQAVKDGAVWIHEAADRGTLGSARAGVSDEPADVAELFSFTKREVETLVDAVDRIQATGDGERLVVVKGAEVSVVPADKKVKPDDADHVSVGLERLRFELDPVAEWRQMFDENATIMAEHYWRADLNGVDWAGAVARYRPLVERLGSHDDLVDLLWETVAELNTSHAYVRAPQTGEPDRLGLLGADLSPADGGWRIDRILPGESSDPKARSPLRAAGVGAQPGDLIVAVSGAPVDPRFGPAAALLGAADQPTELTLRTADGTRRRVVVVPTDDESALRYQHWVRSRAAYVTEHGQGRLGYVHIPDMMGLGWAQLHRDLHLATQADALIVDVRYNGGGHTSQLVIERLARRVIGWTRARHHAQHTSYPEQAPRGPVVFVTNEQAGSDGDIVNAAAQSMGVGPVIGLRTWGGVVGIDGRFDLVDGTGITQPRYAFWFRKFGWEVENHGVDPDIVVEHTPADFFADHDPQLDRGIAEALARLEADGTATPPALPPARVVG